MALSGNMTGTGNYLCHGPEVASGCSSDAGCPTGSACWGTGGVCYSNCAAPDPV
jgi:hypothetical protein